MTRPCFLVVDVEHAGNISTRKLVLETAKLNVITAYSGAEAIEMFDRFPKIDGIVLDTGITDMPCTDVVKRFKDANPQVLVVLIGRPHAPACSGADYALEAFEPAKLLGLLHSLIPEARRVMDRDKADSPTE